MLIENGILFVVVFLGKILTSQTDAESGVFAGNNGKPPNVTSSQITSLKLDLNPCYICLFGPLCSGVTYLLYKYTN